jgi:hypothetical protein
MKTSKVQHVLAKSERWNKTELLSSISIKKQLLCNPPSGGGQPEGAKEYTVTN